MKFDVGGQRFESLEQEVPFYNSEPVHQFHLTSLLILIQQQSHCEMQLT